MKHLIRFLAYLYPASWRRRYGQEFDALLEDTRPDWRTSLDILKGALGMQMQTWNVGKMLVLAGVAGALVALSGSFALPRQYVSEAVVKIGPQRTPAGLVVPTKQDVTNYVNRLEQTVLSRTSLTSVIQNHSLYQSERARMPIVDVIEVMRKNISLLPVPSAGGSPNTKAVVIQFISDDPSTAQKVVRDLSSGFIVQNGREPVGATSMTLEVLDPASLPRNPAFPNRPLFTAVGLAAGLAVGVILAWRRRPSKAKA
jgi:uncharacterized protein involved in exopolysaccharide biosynthesis